MTSAQQLATILLKQDVSEWIAERRPGMSWRKLARELHDATDGQVDVTQQTLYSWHAAALAEAGAA